MVDVAKAKPMQMQGSKPAFFGLRENTNGPGSEIAANKSLSRFGIEPVFFVRTTFKRLADSNSGTLIIELFTLGEQTN
jgi:hypothetical protein